MNKFYTLMIVPEKTSQVRKLVIPAWAVRVAGAGAAFAALLATVMFLDYWYVMSQISENRQLKLENRLLRQQVQVYKDRFTTVENTLDRLKTFATRLKVITNIDDRGNLLQSLNQQTLPDAATNIGGAPARATASAPLDISGAVPALEDGNDASADELRRKEAAELDRRFAELTRQSSFLEQVLHDEYELLADKKDFLQARPTRRPAPGYFTSGFGLRKSPFGGKLKMHEGLDIANVPGTPIRAPAGGVIEFAGVKSGYGETVIIDHGYGLETVYGHTRKILVKVGQHVKRGDTIALLGNTGRSTGPHVHYEVRVRGTPVDPLSYILED